MIAAPDYIDPFEAWRAWVVVRHDGEYSLRSVVERTLWPAGAALPAECLGRNGPSLWPRRKRRHAAPELGCACGIYAGALECVGPYCAEAPCRGVARVVGRVALWGTVIECERGFRASYAYPIRIYVPLDAGEPWRVGWEEVAHGLRRYDVPVEGVGVPAHEATRHLGLEEASLGAASS